MKDWATLRQVMADLHDRVPETIIRGTYDSGQKRDPLGTTVPADINVALERPDPTGEEAIKTQRIADTVGVAIERMCKLMSDALAIAKWVMDDVPKTTDEAVKRDMPNCAACDEPILGRIKAGFDQVCYDRKRYLGIADRMEFRRVRLAELADQDGRE